MTTDQIWANEEQTVFALRRLYQRCGYTPYKMSQFEEYDLYVRNKDFLISDRMITFSGEGGKLMALKPDVTLSIVKNAPETPGVSTSFGKVLRIGNNPQSPGNRGKNRFSGRIPSATQCRNGKKKTVRNAREAAEKTAASRHISGENP